ncbi:TadE/TadG family type IV pilus assembly protein [Sphingomonas sp. RIT328]|uniref:TadE/TadG family type IV pilus assembly protein n=1 Tax=Sphingomonas sp. RIT328 TaxID=1470591 RepID=UPI00044808F2|nr:hypothetical protein [Sphingomonas sp. RIT328]EZP48988.1 TadE-like protein [Sphingomonas sp. RIT328]
MRHLLRATRGVALIEFALTMPLVLGVGAWGTEMAWLAITHLRVSQVALNLADTASRVGLLGASNITQLREADIADVLTSARLQGAALDLTNRGRITISSLEQQTAGSQYLHWQRCLGMRSGTGYDSNYDRSNGTMDRGDGVGTSPSSAGVAMPNGMGDTAATRVSAPVGSGVMYIEVSYDYKPVFSTYWVPGGASATRIRYTASYVVRDRRDFSQIYNPSPAATQYFCDLYTAS